jgi:membrane associated rhomboid family serine protease
MAPQLSRFWAETPEEEGLRLRRSFLPGVLFTGLMWLVFVPAFFLDLDLGHWGLYPRHIAGLRGIITAPLLHADWAHLLSNTFPLILLSAIVFFMFPKAGGRMAAGLYLASGVLAWFMARPAYHIGASGVVYALASLIFFTGMFRHDRNAVAFSLVIAFLYGSMLYGIFPSEGRVSWESHLAGGIAGFFWAFIYRKTDVPPLPPKPAPEPEVPVEFTMPSPVNVSFTGDPQLVIRYTYISTGPAEEAPADNTQGHTLTNADEA